MKLTMARRISLSLVLLMLAVATQGFASPGTPKLPSTLNFQSLNELTVPTTEAEWTFEMSKLDMSICSQHITGLRAHNSDMYLLQYMLLHTVLTDDTTELNALASYATSNGYDVESAFLHYYDDTSVTYSNGITETIKGYGGGTAAALKDARVKKYIWTSNRYIYNLKSPLFQKFKGYYYRKIITTSPNPDGIFIDEVSPTQCYFPTINSGGHVIEYSNQTPTELSSTYMTDMTAAFAQVNSAMGSDSTNYPGGDRILLPNVAEYVGTFMDLGTNGADGLLTEMWMQAVQPRVVEACDTAKQLADKGKILIFAQGTPDPEITVLSNYSSAIDRHQMFSLSNYWLAKQGRYTYYEQKAPYGSPSLSQFWCKSREYDIGTPVDSLYSTWKTGTDSAGQTYTIYKRAYTKALILSRPKVGWTYSDFGTQSQQYDLGGTYQLLHYDGTLGPAITKIGLAMAEAVTLVASTGTAPADTTPPVISGIVASNITSGSATITWTTDENASGSVNYGVSASYGSTGTVTTPAAGQSVFLTGLTPGTTYHYKINATDIAGNTASSADLTFATSAAADTTPPTISSVTAAAITSSGATVSWSTNEAATGSVGYGTTTSYGSSASASTSASSQSVSLTGLNPSTTYHYRVSASDAAGNTSQSADYTFATTSSGGTTPTGFIKHWALTGTFGQGHNTDFIGEATIRPSVGDITAGKTWTDYTSATDQVDIGAAFAQYQNVTSYVNTYVYSPTQRSAQVRIGVDDAAKVFVNGVLVDDNPGYRSASADTDRASVTLNAGWNQLLIKVENFALFYTLYARITDPQGNPFTDLNYQVNAPTGPATGTPKIAITITAGTSTVRVGDQICYTVTYTNTGDGPATSALISAGVDPHVTFVSATNGGLYDQQAKVVRWSVGTLAPGTSGTVKYTVIVN